MADRLPPVDRNWRQRLDAAAYPKEQWPERELAELEVSGYVSALVTGSCHCQN